MLEKIKAKNLHLSQDFLGYVILGWLKDPQQIRKLLPYHEVHEQTLNGWHETNNPTFTVRTSVKPH